METITDLDTVGHIATRQPGATAVFYDLGIDFCCGGGRTLGEACTAVGVDVGLVIARLGKREQEPVEAFDWESAPLVLVVDRILKVYHAPLRADLERIAAWSQKVLDVHGHSTEEPLERLDAAIRALAADIAPHLLKEEQILFPLIEAGRGGLAGGPIAVMRHEHDTAGDLLAEIRSLTGDFATPREACETWQALYRGLAKLDRDLREHIHVENNILFPRALAGQR